MSNLNLVLILFGLFLFIPLGMYSILSPQGAWRLGWFGRRWWFADGTPDPSGSALTSIAVTGFLQVGIGIAMVIGGIIYRPSTATAAQGSGYQQGSANLTLDGAVSQDFTGKADCANGTAQISVLSPTDTTGPLVDNYDGGSIISLDVTLSGSGSNTQATVDIWAVGSNGFAQEAAYTYRGTGDLAAGIVLRSQGGQAFAGTDEPKGPNDTVSLSGFYSCPANS